MFKSSTPAHTGYVMSGFSVEFPQTMIGISYAQATAYEVKWIQF